MRTIEISKLTRADRDPRPSACSSSTGSPGPGSTSSRSSSRVVLTWLFLLGWRSFYRAWLAYNRRRDRFTQRLVIVGTDRRAIELTKLFAIHPEAGMRLRGVIGSRAEAAAAGSADLWLGDYRDADDVLAATPADVVVVCSSDISPLLLNSLLRDGQGDGPPALLPPRPVGHRRPAGEGVADRPRAAAVRRVGVAVPRRSRAQAGVRHRRRVDLAAPVPARSSPSSPLLVKLSDEGPIFFRQQRVGQGDSTFGMLKFRTMVVDAEARLAAARGRQPAQRPAVQARRRPAGHPDRALPAGQQPRRAAAADQRAARAR